jgi:hypothetical protein
MLIKMVQLLLQTYVNIWMKLHEDEDGEWVCYKWSAQRHRVLQYVVRPTHSNISPDLHVTFFA